MAGPPVPQTLQEDGKNTDPRWSDFKMIAQEVTVILGDTFRHNYETLMLQNHLIYHC